MKLETNLGVRTELSELWLLRYLCAYWGSSSSWQENSSYSELSPRTRQVMEVSKKKKTKIIWVVWNKSDRHHSYSEHSLLGKAGSKFINKTKLLL